MNCIPGRFTAVELNTGAGLLALLLWSTTFAVARSLSEQVGPFTAGASVYLAGGIVALSRAALSRRGFAGLALLSKKYVFGCGALFVLYTTLLYAAVGLCANRTQLLEIAVVNYLWPAATLLLSLPLLGKRGGILLVPGTVTALIGVWIVVGQGGDFSFAGFRAHFSAKPLPYMFAFVAAVSWGLYSNLTRRWSTINAPGGITLFVPATGLVLLAFDFLAREHSVWTCRAVCEALGLGTITSLSYGLWEIAMRRGNVLVLALCSYATPLLSTLVSCVYLGVSPDPRLWWGCLLLMLGTVVSWRSVHDT